MMRRTAIPRLLFASLAASSLALLTGRAEADEMAHHFLSPGLLYGVGGRSGYDAQGILGLELDYTGYPAETYELGVGAFAQVHSVAFDHFRVAFGPQINFMFGGVEAGTFIEQGDAKHSTTVGIQISPFLSIGFLSVAFRMGFPFYAGDGSVYPYDLAFAGTLKWPIPIDGDYIGRLF